MCDRENPIRMDISDPNLSSVDLIASKMQRKNPTRKETIEDILRIAKKTRNAVNKSLGLKK